MGIKQNTISELRKKLAESDKTLRVGRGAKNKLKSLLNRISKEDHVPEKKTSVKTESKGLDLFGGYGSAEKRNHLDQPVSDNEEISEERGLERDLSPKINDDDLKN